MKTAEDIINDIKCLPPEEISKVEAYFHTTENGFTPKEEEEILQRIDDVNKGINLSPEFDTVKEMFAYMKQEMQRED
jgi:hypothetical protein